MKGKKSEEKYRLEEKKTRGGLGGDQDLSKVEGELGKEKREEEKGERGGKCCSN